MTLTNAVDRAVGARLAHLATASRRYEPWSPAAVKWEVDRKGRIEERDVYAVLSMTGWSWAEAYAYLEKRDEERT